MKLTHQGLKQKELWEQAGIQLPVYDAEALAEKTRREPEWIHFGIGNIFRIFVGSIADQLISAGDMDHGITCVETYDYEVVDRIYRPYDNLALSVILRSDGTVDKQVLAPFAEAVKADITDELQWSRLKEIFRSPTVKMATFTITEKGYALRGSDGAWLSYVRNDMELGPERVTGAMGVVAAMIKERFEAGAYPIAFVSMDNCSRNGEKLRDSVLTVLQEWKKFGYISEECLAYAMDEERVAFPWTMIDKITPRPSQEVADSLKAAGVEDMDPITTTKKTFIAPFVNAEGPQYLVVEDNFPNGRPPLEKAGVFMGGRDTVNASERMKVTVCLNPLHTALCTYDCMLGYDLFADGMHDPQLSRLADLIGYGEGMPVVSDPGILSPKAFLDEVVHERFPNPYLGDTSQRIATDISQMVGIRFGETIKSYVKRDGTAASLVGIPLAIAGWIRYLLALDDNGNPMELAPDPMIEELQEQLKGVKLGDPDSLKDQLKPILSNKLIFGSDLYEAGIGEKIERMVREQLEGPGAVRKTLQKYLGS